MAETDTGSNYLELATELTIAWLANPNTRTSAEEVPSFLQTMYSAVSALSLETGAGADQQETPPEFTPAVTVRKSLSSKDHIISLVDGKPYKTLRRHLARHGLTPEQYRERYGLKKDYPMVAENYAEVRRNLAKKIGLGRKPRNASDPATPSKQRGGASASSGAKPARAARTKSST